MAGSNFKDFIQKDLAELKSSFEQKGVEKTLADANEKLLNNTTLDIAITGIAGSGKSSLVNAFRNMSDFEPGAAKTGVEETTMKPEKYPHPLFPGLQLWDLPGIGTTNFKAKDYLEKVNFPQYDFFIIVASDRFTQHDSELATEIQKAGKKFYFVRTKMDLAINDEQRKPGFNKEQTENMIREYCRRELRKVGGVMPPVFLISSRHFKDYDFPLLQKNLAADLNDLKRDLLTKALPAFSRENLQAKKAVLEARIRYVALTSCAVGMVPVPGVSLAFDIGCLVGAMIDYCKTFGLDDVSLRSLAYRVGKPFEVLRSAVKKTPKIDQINPEYVNRLISKYLLCSSAMVLEETTKVIPFFGSIIGGVSSYTTTYYMLTCFLEDAVNDAENVLEKVKES